MNQIRLFPGLSLEVNDHEYTYHHDIYEDTYEGSLTLFVSLIDDCDSREINGEVFNDIRSAATSYLGRTNKADIFTKVRLAPFKDLSAEHYRERYENALSEIGY